MIGPVGNVYDKYSTKNPIARALMNGFLCSVGGLYRASAPRRVLEVGCGEGRLAHELMKQHAAEDFIACDLRLDKLAGDVDGRVQFIEASIYELPFADSSFDMVVCCEVLEHLAEPERGLREVARVSKRHALLSTPREPLWRVLNMARGKYLAQLGNTPGHVQHFSSRQLRELVSRQFHIEACQTPLPWTVILAGLRA